MSRSTYTLTRKSRHPLHQRGPNLKKKKGGGGKERYRKSSGFRRRYWECFLFNGEGTRRNFDLPEGKKLKANVMPRALPTIRKKKAESEAAEGKGCQQEEKGYCGVGRGEFSLLQGKNGPITHAALLRERASTLKSNKKSS